MVGKRKFIRAAIVSVELSVLMLPSMAQAMPTTFNKVYAQKDETSVIVKLRASAQADLVNNDFVSNNKPDDVLLRKLLSDSKVSHKTSLIASDKKLVKQNRAALATALAPNEGDLQNYYVLQLDSNQNADDVADKLKSLSIVETAYAKPLPAPAPLAPSFSSTQNYIKAAPTGMTVNATIGGSATTNLYPGINGSKVQVADLEYSWNTQHEDLSKLRTSGAVWANGTPSDPFNDNNHGTAVAGVISADHNNAGVDGIVGSTSYHMVNTYNTERGWDIPNAVYSAANALSAGDVILIEQQAWAPDNLGFAPVEITQANYDAIKYATAKGINVIEPAGNGKQDYSAGYDLSNPIFNGVFTTARTNSGAIIVGAAGAGGSCSTAHARIIYSNYGSRLDMQGYGECVVTTGYGGLYNAGANALYTSTFGGTSSASATIAAVATELSSSYKYTNNTVMTPTQLKAALKNGGTLQNNVVNPGNIGVLPNMAYALRLTDIKAPTAPTNLIGKSVAANQIFLTWTAASDNLGYVKYYIYRNGVKIATTSNTTYTDLSIRDKVTFTYKVYAVDASSNKSVASNSVSVVNQ